MSSPLRISILLLALPAAAVIHLPVSGDASRPGPPPGTYTMTPDVDSIRIPFEIVNETLEIFAQAEA